MRTISILYLPSSIFVFEFFVLFVSFVVKPIFDYGKSSSISSESLLARMSSLVSSAIRAWATPG